MQRGPPASTGRGGRLKPAADSGKIKFLIASRRTHHARPFRFPDSGAGQCLRREQLKRDIMSDVQQKIDQIVKGSPVVLFMKGTAQFPMCGFSGRAIQILKACGVDAPTTVNVLEDDGIRQGIKTYANWPTIPQLYVNGEFVGGSDIMMEMYQNGELQSLLKA